jgi:hypothetical protein
MNCALSSSTCYNVSEGDFSHVICPSPPLSSSRPYLPTLHSYSNIAISIYHFTNEKGFQQIKVIHEAAETYKNDENLSIRAAATLHHIYHTSIKNYLDNKTKSTFNQFGSYQKLSSIEKCVLE